MYPPSSTSQAALLRQEQEQEPSLLHAVTFPSASSRRSSSSSWQSIRLQGGSPAPLKQDVPIREPGAIRQAVARLSLDSGSRRLFAELQGDEISRSSGSPGPSSSWLASQSAQARKPAAWQGQAPVGPEDADTGRNPSFETWGGSFVASQHADISPTDRQMQQQRQQQQHHDKQLLQQLPRQQQQEEFDPAEGHQILQQLQRQRSGGELGRGVVQVERASSTPPFLQETAQQYGAMGSGWPGDGTTMMQPWQMQTGGADSRYSK